MGLAQWWDRHGVPRVIRFACGMKPIMELRAQVVPLAEGEVFELGCGGGINQGFYRTGAVSRYCGIDPSPKLREYAEAAARAKGWPAEIREGWGRIFRLPAPVSIRSCVPTQCVRSPIRPRSCARCTAS